MPKKTIQIAEFAPDMVDFDSPHMEVCENLVPIRGEYAPVFGGQDIGSVSDTNRIIAGYAHVVSRDLDVQTSRPEEDYDPWSPSDPEVESPDTYTMIGEVTPNDDTYIYNYDSLTSSPNFAEALYKLSDLNDPADDTDHVLSVRWRGWEANGGVTTSNFIANIYHFDGSTWTKVEQTASDLIDESITVSGQWVTSQGTITTADVNAALNFSGELDDYEELYLSIDPTMSLNGAQDNYYYSEPTGDSLNDFQADGWESTVIGNTDYWSEILSTSDPDDEYITTPGLTEDETVVAKFDLSWDSLLKMGTDHIPEVTVRAKASVASDVYDRFKLYKDDELVYTSAWRELSTSFATDATEPALTVFSEWDFFDGIRLEWEVKNEATGGASQTYEPASSGYDNSWTKVGGASNHAILSDDDDDSYLRSETIRSRFEVTLASAEKPSDHNGTKFRIKAMHSTGSSGKLKVTLTDGTNTYTNTFSSDAISGSSFKWLTWNLNTNQSSSLDWDGGGFDITVHKEGGSGIVDVSECELITSSEGVTADLAFFYIKTAVDVGYEVSWAKFTIPAEEVDITGDSQRIYGGTRNDLFEVTDLDIGTIDDRTNDDLDAVSNKYGSGDSPKVWDFCSWGGNVIATNWSDPVQLLDIENDSAQFDNLITNVDSGSTLDLDATPSDAPRAKYCAVVQNNLVLANLNYSGHFSYSLCWSHINDPAQFSFPSYTYLSDSQTLVQTPGEITGIVGGDYGTIFKRNSVYRMSYVGSPLMYRFDVIARGVGTSYPKSIVTAGDDIYFFGDDAFYVMRGGGKPEPISEGKVSRMFTDNPLEFYFANGVALNSRSYYPHEEDKQYKIDSSLYGAYDRTNSVIYWVYTCQGDNWWKKTKCLAYNIKSNKWGLVDFREIRTSEESDPAVATDRFKHVSVPIGLLNTRTDISDRYGGLIFWSKHDISATNSLWRPISKYTRPASLKTALFSSKSFGADEGDAVRIKRVRPVFYNNDENSDYIRNLTLTIIASDDPYFDSTNSSESIYGTNTDEHGWFDVKQIAGEYFRVKLDIPSWAHYAYENAEFSGPVSGIVALQFDVDYAGDF